MAEKDGRESLHGNGGQNSGLDERSAQGEEGDSLLDVLIYKSEDLKFGKLLLLVICVILSLDLHAGGEIDMERLYLDRLFSGL